MQRILSAVDLSDASRAAFEVACDLAKGGDAPLLLVHAFQDAPRGVGISKGYMDPINQVRAVTTQREASLLTKEWADKAREKGIQVEVITGETDAPSLILKTARARDASMIVVGTHGRSGIRRIFLGSVAEAIVRHAEIPVLVVPSAHIHATR